VKPQVSQEKALGLPQGRPPGGGGSWRGGGRGGHGPIRGGDRQAASQNARGRQGREGVDREVGLAEKVAPRGRSGSRRGPPASQGGKGTARVPASRGPQRGGGHGPNRGGEGRPNGPATASSGRTGGGVPGPRNREMGSPELPAGGSRAVAGRACGPGRTRISGREAHPYRGTPLSPTPG